MTPSPEFTRRWLAVCGLVLGLMSFASTAAGQDTDDHADHSEHAMAHGEANAVPVESAGDQSAMDHGTIQMAADMGETGESTEDRSPHAYANGYTLRQGPYALPVTEQLILADQHSFSRLIVNRRE